jgi:mannose-6-phosphate isomerase-like protein (cupin superfamily)
MNIHNIHDHKGDFFKALDTTPQSQIAVQTIKAGESAGPAERHPGDQVFLILEGEAEVQIEKEPAFCVKPGDTFVVPKQTRHHLNQYAGGA